MKDLTTEPEILTQEEKLRLQLVKMVNRVFPPGYTFFQKVILKEIEKASPSTLEQIRKELLELIK